VTRRVAAFLDRDGVLNVRAPEHAYVTSVDGFRWIEGAANGAARIAALGFTLFVVSNQRGVARGLVTANCLREIEERIDTRLAALGAAITAYRYCVHELDEGCACRKPAPGMLTQLAAEFDVDLGASWMIGDSESDVAAGRGAGCRTIRICNGATETAADMRAPSLLAASDLLQSAAANSTTSAR
jgi:D-glycero-D-manno-heptose 1,7-bisphosphate phosphatase